MREQATGEVVSAAKAGGDEAKLLVVDRGGPGRVLQEMQSDPVAGAPAR